jgi:hypothetical protein
MTDDLTPTMRLALADIATRRQGAKTATTQALRRRGLTEPSDEWPFEQATAAGLNMLGLSARRETSNEPEPYLVSAVYGDVVDTPQAYETVVEARSVEEAELAARQSAVEDNNGDWPEDGEEYGIYALVDVFARPERPKVTISAAQLDTIHRNAEDLGEASTIEIEQRGRTIVMRQLGEDVSYLIASDGTVSEAP